MKAGDWCQSSSSQAEKRVHSFFLHIFFYSGLQLIRWGPPHWGGFPSSSNDKESTCNEGDLGSSPGSGRSPREGYGNSFQYSCLENSIDRGAWHDPVHGGCKESDTTEWATTTTTLGMKICFTPSTNSMLISSVNHPTDMPRIMFTKYLDTWRPREVDKISHHSWLSLWSSQLCEGVLWFPPHQVEIQRSRLRSCCWQQAKLCLGSVFVLRSCSKGGVQNNF